MNFSFLLPILALLSIKRTASSLYKNASNKRKGDGIDIDYTRTQESEAALASLESYNNLNRLDNHKIYKLVQDISTLKDNKKSVLGSNHRYCAEENTIIKINRWVDEETENI